MPIQLELVREGQRVAYHDVANPRRTGRVAEVDPANQWSPYTIRWDDDGTTSRTDLRQHGWDLLEEAVRLDEDGAAAGIFDGAEVIHVYTRDEAIADGVLVDVTETAREAGFTVPVALTRAAWEEAVAWEHGGWQDETGRLWDVCWMARAAGLAASRRDAASDRTRFAVLRVPNRPACHVARRLDLELHCGPGDEGDPVMTIMCPGES